MNYLRRLCATGLLLLLAGSFASAKPFEPNVGHDSVTFDGAEIAPSPVLAKSNCYVRVTRVTGLAYGWVHGWDTATICGGRLERIETWDWQMLIEGDEVRAGDTIMTGPRGRVSFSVGESTDIYLKEGTTMILAGDFCHAKDKIIRANLYSGEMVVRRFLAPFSQSEIYTGNTRVRTKGTTYSVRTSGEVGTDDDVVKVFEGEVEVFPDLKNATSPLGDLAKQIDKLSDDFQHKRITMEQFNRRMMTLQTSVKEHVDKAQNSVLLTAGQECSINRSGVVSKPVTMNSPDRWFEE